MQPFPALPQGLPAQGKLTFLAVFLPAEEINYVKKLILKHDTYKVLLQINVFHKCDLPI